MSSRRHFEREREREREQKETKKQRKRDVLVARGNLSAAPGEESPFMQMRYANEVAPSDTLSHHVIEKGLGRDSPEILQRFPRMLGIPVDAKQKITFL